MKQRVEKNACKFILHV